MRLLPFEPGQHLAAIVTLCQAAGWSTYADDPALAARAFAAPGVVALVAVCGDTVAGFVQAQGDGAVQSHLSLLLVAPPFRRRGIGRRLVEEAFRRTGTRRMDVWTDDPAARRFYQSLSHRGGFGLRLYPGGAD